LLRRIGTLGIARVGFLTIVLTLCTRAAAAQYYVESWTTEQGLPHNIVAAFQQTRDGYIWMATADGLVRFDGVRFTVFNRGNSPGLTNNRFTALYEAADGAIWAGTEGSGVTRYARGAFTTYTVRDGLYDDHIRAVTGDAAGNVWVLAGHEIVRWDGARFQPAAPQGLTLRFYRSDWNTHVWWASDRERLYRFAAGQLSVRPIPAALQGLPNNRFEEDSAGALWMGTLDGRIAQITGTGAGTTVRYHDIPDLLAPDGQIPSAWRDRGGHEWPLTINRLMVRFWSLPQRDTPALVNAVLEDREGNIWLGADGQGLFRIRQPRVTVYSRAQGLLGQNVYPVLMDRSGSIWMGVWPTGVSRITNGRVVNYTVADGLASGYVTSLAEDRQGRVWVASHHDVNGGLRVFDNGRFREVGRTLVPPQRSIHAMLHDRRGVFWLGSDAGLVRDQDGVVTTFTTKDGLSADDVKTLIEDPDGRIWAGTFGGVTSWKDGVIKSWTERDGLPGGVVRALYRDRDGVLWVGTYDGGLGRYKDGRFSRITTNEGLFDNGVFQILEDRRGYFWMGGNRGIHRVSKRELNAVADGAANRVTSLSLGKGDGLLNAECNGGTWPSGTIGPNGTLWFPTQDGVAMIDPASILVDQQPLPVVIESVLVDRTLVPFQQTDGVVRIGPEASGIEIAYTGLSFKNAERIRFRFMLEGLDREWTDAGTRRTAYYSHLPAGDYVFLVTAANSDGVWNTGGQRLRIIITPPFYQRSWFLGLILTCAIAAAAIWHHRRLARVRAAHAAQAEFSRKLLASQEQERQRIAGELHDSLGQQLLVIRNRAMLGETLVEDPARSRGQFDEIVSSATDAIAEVRAIAHNLRPVNLERLGLTASIEEMVEAVASATGLQFSADIEPLDGLLSEDEAISCYRIIQESANNIVKHAAATKAYVEMWREDGALRITVRDNGRGVDAQATRQSRGLGLTSITERVRMLGGTLTIESAPGEGTALNIQIPLSRQPRRTPDSDREPDVDVDPNVVTH
jgi:signal transduction histidine kinase/ligand-binding sensor domain-containing protein